MIKLPKKLAFIIFVTVIVFLGISFFKINWDILHSKSEFGVIYKELRETLMFLLLVAFYTIYYVSILKKKDKTK